MRRRAHVRHMVNIMRAWFACVFICIALVFEDFLGAPYELMMATIAAFIFCGALFVAQMLNHMGYKTYDKIRVVVMGGLFIFIFTRPYPTHWLILVYLAIYIPLNMIYPDKSPGSDE
jgi:hypothetical protein